MDQDTLLGGLFLSAILFAVLWFFFGITWWVIAAPFVLMTLVLLGSTDDDPDEATMDYNIPTAETPPPATVYESEPTQPSMTLLTTDVDMDGERALEIIQRGVAVYDHTMTTLVEPGIARTTEFLTNRGANIFHGVCRSNGFKEDSDRLREAIRYRRLDQNISAAFLQKIVDQNCAADPYSHFSSLLQCGVINPEKHFAFSMSKQAFCLHPSNEVDSLDVVFYFSNALPEFCRVKLCPAVERITDADHWCDLWRSLVTLYGVPSGYVSLNHWLEECRGRSAFHAYLEHAQVEGDDFPRWWNELDNLIAEKEVKGWMGPLEDLTPEIIESVSGSGFRRFVKENPPTVIPWTPWI